MAAWNFELEIIPQSGASGTLTFQGPVTGSPPNHVFGSNGLGIAVTNGGNTLSANDFFNPSSGSGAPVPGGVGANLLQVDFPASSNASGPFAIYAMEGPFAPRKEHCSRRVKDDTDIPQASTPATPNCNLHLNHA